MFMPARDIDTITNDDVFTSGNTDRVFCRTTVNFLVTGLAKSVGETNACSTDELRNKKI